MADEGNPYSPPPVSLDKDGDVAPPPAYGQPPQYGQQPPYGQQ